ncbi:MAG: preprotein translocase subunit SecA [Candidatus Krumholzibacteriota bacterium]|nr:preprotein translocase subunit SecA [Candidatus Krumholzibacteriota bacterium]
MFKAITKRLFGDRQGRLVKKLGPVVAEIRSRAESYRSLEDGDFPRKTAEFRDRLAAGETVDDILVEAFALVHEACRRHVGRSWPVVGNETSWEMVPYDVQLMGAIVLHNGSIAEMATGEGKTLVATMPLYLNALPGKGAHLVTVNDYLARRDAEWMGEIYRFLGLSVGYLLNDMSPAQRREIYACDITYGTNNEFGFDYLRDNMKLRADDQVQRGYHYAIVDEVDSVLVDEARTPLIISGPVQGSSRDEHFIRLRGKVESLVKNQKRMINELMTRAGRIDPESGEAEDDDGFSLDEALLLAKHGDPKNKQFTKLRKKPGYGKLMLALENSLMRDKTLHDFDEQLYFVIDEKANSIDLTEKGRQTLSAEDREMFVLPDLSLEIKEIESDDSLDVKEKVRRKDAAYRNYAEKSEIIHSFSQLFKAYTLFEKDHEYVVQDGRVMIVDEFTGRMMPGRRFSDGLHQALEAKERVQIEGETQTLATITLQNYFRMYDKLAGMTGTAETEEEEFHKIYGLEVHVLPTNKPIRRVDYDDVIFRTKREKYQAIAEEIARLHRKGLPVLVGTVSVEVSETLSRMLKRDGIPHNVLNAKYHQREAEIVAEAGRAGGVTIATNMAGRGTDIKLEASVVKCDDCVIRAENGSAADRKKADECFEDVPCGLHIIGTERHESRRIDRQLRGRAGRQGDPGASRFFISLEDDLMRLFGSERISGVMDRLGVEEGEVITHSFITGAISRAQKKVEMYNFGIRKRLLEYDDVMNKQREVIYGRRNDILGSEDLDGTVLELVDGVVADIVDAVTPHETPYEEWDLDAASVDLESIFIFPFDTAKLDDAVRRDSDRLGEFFRDRAREAYELRKSTIPPDVMQQLVKMIMLQSIDEKWMDHLYELDSLREGIHFRSYAQKDPLVEYKQEAFSMFAEMVEQIDRAIIRGLFHARLDIEQEGRRRTIEPGVAVHHVASAYGGQAQRRMPATPAGGGAVGPSGPAPAAPQEPVRAEPKVGRNDPCPCGSGKKYKKCCGRTSG